MKTKLTAAVCRALACLPGQKKEVVRCTELTGFGIEVRASGKKTYYLYYTTPDRSAAQIRIGGYGDISFEAAKRKAQELRSRVVLGANPAVEKATRRATPRYAELARQHKEHAATYQRSHENTAMLIDRYLVPKFGHLAIDAIQPQAIETYLAELRKTKAPATVDKIRVVFHRSYVLAAKWGMPGSERNPVAAVSRPRYDNRREIFLTATQAQRLLECCGASPSPMLRPIAHLLVLTGARKRELLDAKWENVDIERRTWRIPDSKSGRGRYLPLSQAALDVINGLPRYDNCPWLVPNPDTRRPFDNIKRSWDTARKAAGLPTLRIHDLRHSAASFMVNSGVDLYQVGRLLGHAAHSSTTSRYSHLANDTLLAAVEAGAAKLAG